ncbi:MAG: hypothetical protein CL693_16810 [Cellvibrionaceae bacterium]|nr:hypothetical protein [Cellvibrionaceae bacterium]
MKHSKRTTVRSPWVLSGWPIYLLLLICWGQGHASENWLDQQKSEFKRFSEGSQQQLQDYQQQQNTEFGQWLSHEWQAFEQYRGLIRDAAPKFSTPPRIGVTPLTANRSNRNEPLDTSISLSTPLSITQPGVEDKMPEITGTVSAKAQAGEFWFYGHSLRISTVLPSDLPKIADQQDIRDAWLQLSNSTHQPQLQQLRATQETLELSDWATVQMVQRYSQEMPVSHNQQTMVAWFYLSQLGYRVCVGFSGRHLFLLYATEQTLYEKPFYLVEGERYYPTSAQVTGSMTSYPEYPAEARKPLQMDFSKTFKQPTLRAGGQPEETNQSGQPLKLRLSADRLSYFQSYPQIDLVHYFRAEISPEIAEAVRSYWRQQLAQLPPVDQVNQLLIWLHRSFDYARDQQQFGAENYLLPEESLYYPASDCEDRSFLLAWMVREILDLPVIGLVYPGHVAIAVGLPQNQVAVQSNKPIRYFSRDYWVADPTYFGAKLGQVMPDFVDIKPQVIAL